MTSAARATKTAIQPTHAEFQEQIIDLAHLYGWEHLHVRRTVGRGKKWTTSTNLKGWPDCLFWKAGRGFIAVEIKIHPDKPTPEQTKVLASLAAAGAATMVAYPEHLPEVQALLAGKQGDV